ncbi:MAG: PorP/SprF family type IX secretion system membrane protein [Bacteroidota bacterium]
MRQLKSGLLSALFILSSVYVSAQDQHFTQFYASPLNLNPALTGAIEGTYRIGLNYRNQGRNQAEVPYTTTSAAVDLRVGLDSRRRVRRDKFGVGMVFYSDRNSFVNLFTNYIGVGGAFHKSLDKNSTQFLSVGFQFGVAQKNVSYDNFTFDDQFNGSNAFNLGTREILPTNNFAYSDLAVGLNYAYTPNRGIAFYAGASMYHVMEPEISFFTEAESPGTDNLFRRYTAHLSLAIPLTEYIQILPRALGYIQGPHTMLNGGTNLRFEFANDENSALHVGGWGRFTTNAGSGISWDAAIGMVGIEYKNFLFGVSYDAKVLSFTAGGNPQSALEFSFTYIGNYDNSLNSLCPGF